MVKQIFINLPVADLKKSMQFFSQLGFSFNEQFTDDNAACLIIGKNIYAMLLTQTFFSTFTPKAICDAARSTEVLLALSVANKDKVNAMMAMALAAGAKEARQPQDHGWMYGRSFEDLDGHIWEILWMEIKNS